MTDSTPTPSENSQQPAPAAGGTPPATSVAATPPEKPAEPAKAPEPIKAEAPPPQPTPPPADVVPDAYELKAPEGQQFDAALLTSLAPTFKELGLTNAKAQKLADAFIKVQQTNHAKAMARDLERTMADPDIGQMNWGRTVGEVNRALAAFTNPEDRKWIEGRGDGNRLEYVRLFARIGRAMAEDRPARGGPTTAEKPTTARKLYGGGDLVGAEKQ